MIYLLIFLQLADIATTHYALRTGIGTEANPVLRKLFDSICCAGGNTRPSTTHGGADRVGIRNSNRT